MEDLLGGWSNKISDVDYEHIVDLLVEFDEMGFMPTTTCSNADEYAIEWKKKLLEAVNKLNFERKDAINECNKVYDDLSKEIDRLENEKEEIRLFNLALENGEIDMSIESEMAKSFYNSIVQIFEKNGATNFFTTTVDIGGKKGRYAFTIEKVGSQTVAEKLAEQKAEIERLTEELKNLDWYKMWHKQFKKEIDDLTLELETYRPTKLSGNGQCKCSICGVVSWTDWFSRYKGQIICDECLKELLEKKNI